MTKDDIITLPDKRLRQISKRIGHIDQSVERLAADMIAALSEVARRELRHPGRILITGAVSSAAVGGGFTVLARRRGSRRHADAGGPPNGKGA